MGLPFRRLHPSCIQALDAAGPETKQSKRQLLADYFDRRAQAKYNAENPNSALAVPQQKEFASRFSDPNHSANSGSLISLVTGGHVSPHEVRNYGRGAMPGAQTKMSGQDYTRPARPVGAGHWAWKENPEGGRAISYRQHADERGDGGCRWV